MTVPEHLRATPRPPRDLAMSNQPFKRVVYAVLAAAGLGFGAIWLATHRLDTLALIALCAGTTFAVTAVGLELLARAEQRLCTHGDLAVATVTSCMHHRSKSRRTRVRYTFAGPGGEVAGRTDFELGAVKVPDGFEILVAFDAANPRRSTVYFITA